MGIRYFHYRYNMEAKEKHGNQGATWMEAKERQFGGQRAIWRPKSNKKAPRQSGSKVTRKQEGSPHMPWGSSELKYALSKPVEPPCGPGLNLMVPGIIRQVA